MKPVIVMTTVGVEFDARELARQLVDLRLAACVNILPPIESVYRWQGEVTSAKEQLLLIKSSSERLDDLQAALLDLHPYEVPEFVVVETDRVAPAYAAWLEESL